MHIMSRTLEICLLGMNQRTSYKLPDLGYQESEDKKKMERKTNIVFEKHLFTALRLKTLPIYIV